MDFELLAEIEGVASDHLLISLVGSDKIELLVVSEDEPSVWLDKSKASKLARILLDWANQ